jgi:hypothetical protein
MLVYKDRGSTQSQITTTVSPFSWVGAETDEDQADLVEKLVWEGVGEYVHRI